MPKAPLPGAMASVAGALATPQLIFNEFRDCGEGVFIYDALNNTGPAGPVISPGMDNGTNRAGDAEAPLLIGRFTRITNSTLFIYYTMSTWNPYTVVKMRSPFTITPVMRCHEKVILSVTSAMKVASRFAVFMIWLLGLALESEAQIQTNVVVSFVTTKFTPLNPRFSGFNSTADNAVEYYDTNFQQIVTTLSAGWLRYPAGTESDAFDWRTGQMVQAWVDGLAADSGPQKACAGTLTNIAGKGGALFSDFSAMAANVGGARIVVDVNAFTDTANSAGAFAQYALTNHIQVAAWELCNEAYLFTGAGNFFTNGGDYAAQMKPFRDAIKTADSNAVVVLFFSDAGHPNAAWDNALASYTNQYWDAVTYHHYISPGSLTNFNDLMALANGVLVSNTTSHVMNYLMSMNQTNTL